MTLWTWIVNSIVTTSFLARHNTISSVLDAVTFLKSADIDATDPLLRSAFKPTLLFHHSLQAKDDNNDVLQLFTITTDILETFGVESSASSGFKISSQPVKKPSCALSQGVTRQERLEPNVTDKETVVNLAKMTSNAYILDPTQPDWLNISLGFNVTDRFGWEDDGLRGQVFSTEDNSTIVVSFKGTSVNPGDPWRSNDRLNDNRLFSCCCGAQNPWGYAPVCKCQEAVYQCNSTCLTESLLGPDIYYKASLEVMQNISSLFPESTVWVIGHSLGGSLASLVGLTLNIPAVAFEAPPEKLPAERLGLLQPHSATAYHFGNTGDPVYMGACNGFFSSCSALGFSFESQCFTGKRCVYDTVADKGWRLSITNHRINYVIKNVLEAYDTVPICHADDECFDCYNWKFD